MNENYFFYPSYLSIHFLPQMLLAITQAHKPSKLMFKLQQSLKLLNLFECYNS